MLERRGERGECETERESVREIGESERGEGRVFQRGECKTERRRMCEKEVRV